MEKLLDGVHRFQQQEFGKYKGLFRRLSRQGQNPHTLFITCADSRVLAELITQSNPGDLFVIKNVGNIVPPPDETSCSSTGAGIEFAVETLGVSDIVVCGHSQCGAISALMNAKDPLQQQTLFPTDELPHLRNWIALARPVRDLIEQNYTHLKTDAERLRAAEEENVLFSIERLHQYACVARRLAEGSLRLHAWFFKIASAELFAYDPEQRQFHPITEALNHVGPNGKK
jgi:carbonic anhydrase